jgi:hypothetical protein
VVHIALEILVSVADIATNVQVHLLVSNHGRCSSKTGTLPIDEVSPVETLSDKYNMSSAP